MEQGKKKTYTVKDPARLAVVVAAAAGILLLVLGWVFFLGRVRRQTAERGRERPSRPCWTWTAF